MVLYYGRRVTAAEDIYGWSIPKQTGVTVFNKATKNLWLRQIFLWGGKFTATNAQYYLSAYGCDDDEINPDNLIARTALGTATTLKTGAGGGAQLGGNVVADGDGNSIIAAQIWNGKRYGFGHTTPEGQLNFSMEESANLPATTQNRKLYRRNGSAMPPSVLKPYSTATIEGHQSIWGVCEENVAPTVGTVTPSGSINGVTPTITAQFRDKNAGHLGGVDVGDYMTKARIQVVTDDALETILWDSGNVTPSSTERNNDLLSRNYAGDALTPGGDYKVHVMFYDRFNVASGWSDWQSFSIADLGYITAGSAPSGKIETNQPDFTYHWEHVSGDDMEAVRVWVQTQNGASVAQSGWITEAAEPGDSGTIAWGDTGFANPLTKGAKLRYLVRGRDEDNDESPWSRPQYFSVNAVPDTPSMLSPDAGAISTSYPLLTSKSADVDDTPATGHVVYCEIFDTGGDLTATRVKTYNAGTDRWEYQTVLGDHPDGYGVYTYCEYSYDGTYYSGGATSSGDAQRSLMASWTYAEGPVVTITAPTLESVITEAEVPVAWTVDSGGPQTHYRIVFWEAGTDTAFYDSGIVESTDDAVIAPSGSVANETSYEAEVLIRNSLGVWGSSGRRFFSVAFTPPAIMTGIQVTEWQGYNDPFPTGIALSWNQSTEDETDFSHYLIIAVGGGSSRVWRIYSQGTTHMVDYEPASAVEYDYHVFQVLDVAGAVLTSPPAIASLALILGGSIYSSVVNPEGLRVALNIVEARSHRPKTQETYRVPLAGPALPNGQRATPKPVTTRSTAYWWETSVKAKLLAQVGFSVDPTTQRLQAEDIHLRGGIYCERDEKGRRRFVTITGMSVEDGRRNRYDLSMNTREETYTEETLNG